MHIYRRALFYAFFLAVSRAFIAPLPTRVSLIHSCHESRGSSRLRAVSSVSDNKELLPGILAIQESNRELLQHLDSIRQKPYFRFYSVDILASCEYMPQELHECDDACEIYPVDEEEVPADIQQIDMDEHDFDLDGWGRWDMPSEDYYDTKAFPEGYTGYDGTLVWNFIHNRICFSDFDYDDDHWKADYNKAVSGLHSSVSAHVIRGIQKKIDDGESFAENEIWRDPQKEFVRRLSPSGETPLAVENLYFYFMLLLTAASKAKRRLLSDCASGKIDADTATELKAVLSSPLLDEPSVSVAFDKLHDHALNTSSDLWEARMRTRELVRIMNCVQCNKCRLHGKIATLGLSTALQILVGRTGDGEDPDRVHRVELAALMTSLHKASRAVDFCQSMMTE